MYTSSVEFSSDYASDRFLPFRAHNQKASNPSANPRLAQPSCQRAKLLF